AHRGARRARDLGQGAMQEQRVQGRVPADAAGAGARVERGATGAARGKLLKEQMENPGGLKFIRGECLFEKNAITFVVQAAAAGLAKKIRAALLKQTELRLKVRVRGENPEDLEEDGNGEDAPGGVGATAEAVGEASPRPPDPLKARFEARLEELEP